EPAHPAEAKALGALQHLLQDWPAIERNRHVPSVFLQDELSEEEIHAVGPRHVAMRAQVEPRQRVGESLVPAGQRRVGVARVAAIPAEYHIAKAEAAFDRRLELVLVNIFAAQDPVDIRHGQLSAMTRRVPYGG